MAVAAALSLLLLVSCSVSTPRNGVVAAGDGVGDASASGAPASGGGRTTVPGAGRGSGDTSPDAGGTDGSGTASVPASVSAGGGEGGESGGGPPSGDAGTPAGAGGSAVGVTDDTIVVSVLAGYSGTYGVLFRALVDNGYGLWADEVNDQGGINGRRIEIRRVDNRDTAEGGVAACKEVQGNGSFLAISLAGLGGADISSADCLDQAGVPIITSNLAGFRDSWRYVISAFDAGRQAAPLASFIANVLGDASGKIGLIVNNDPIHFTGRDALNTELKRLGMSTVREETISPGQGSFVAELSRLRSAGATTVVMLTGNESIGIVRDARAMGYAPNFTGVFWTLDEFSQAASQLWKGIEAIRGWPTTDSEAYKRYVEAANRYGRTSLVNSTVMATYGHGRLVGDIIAATGQAPTREAIPPAAEQLGSYTNGILSLTFRRGVRVADVAMFPIVCCNPDNTWRGNGAPATEF